MTQSKPSVPNIYEAVGARIRSERTKQHLTQEDLAVAVKLKRTSITNIEKGRQKLLLHTLVALAEALGIPPSQLLAPLETNEPSQIESTLPSSLSQELKEWVISGVQSATRSSRTKK